GDAREVIHALARGEPADERPRQQVLSRDGRVLARAGLPGIRVHFRVDRVLQQAGEVGDRQVVEKFHRESGHGAGRVARTRIQPATRGGVLGEIANVLAGIHREGAQLVYRFLGGGRRGGGG